MKKLILPILFFIIASVAVAPVLAQEKDSLIACIEEIKQLRAKDGPRWYEKNTTSCLGDRAIGKFSVLPLTEYDQKEIYNDMELEFYAFFDTPVDGVEVREGQMEYQETSKPNSPGPGYRVEKKVEHPGIGDKSLHQVETTYVNIAAESSEMSPILANYTIYQELMVTVGDCSFMVGGRAAPNYDENRVANWLFNHYVSYTPETEIVNSNHDHGEGIIKERIQEIARDLVDRVSSACAGQKAGGTEAKKEEPAGWELPGKGFGEFIRKIQSLRLKPDEEVGEAKQEEIKPPANAVNDWIQENFGPYQPKIEEAFPPSLLERRPKITPQVSPDDFITLGPRAGDTLSVSYLDANVEEKAQIQLSNVDDVVDLIKSEISSGSTIFTGKNIMMIITPNGGMISVERQTRMTVVDINLKATDARGPKNALILIQGEAEVKTGGDSVDIETPNAVIKSKGTHYWVSYDHDRSETIVGVYEGEVEVETKDGQIIKVVPDGDKPGVVVVSQKFSPIKLAIAGAVLLVFLAGIALFLKRKFFSKGVIKKKK